MPERIEVQIMVEKLNQCYKGKILKQINFCSGRYITHSLPKNYKVFNKALPLKIKNFNVKGKFIWITFDKSDWIIFITLGLTGHFKYNEDGKYCRYRCEMQNGKFCMDDMRNFGTISFVEGKDVLEKKLKSIGPDVFNKQFTLSVFKNIIENQKPDKLLGIFLLEQKHLAGIGNYLRCDILYTARLSPFRTIKSLTITDIGRLYRSIKKIIKESYRQQLKKGLHEYNFLVYKRKITLKKEPVAHEKIGSRNIYWVPRVQK